VAAARGANIKSVFLPKKKEKDPEEVLRVALKDGARG